MTATAMVGEVPNANLAELTDFVLRRDEREASMDVRVREAVRCLQPLINDLPTSDAFLLAPKAVKSWRVLRDQDPECFMIYLSMIRAKLGNNIQRLISERVGPPQHGAGALSPVTSEPLSEFLQKSAPEYTIKGLLPQRGFGIAYGESGSGKTFVILDLALSVARGVPWRGHRVKRGGVIYLCAEGGSGLANRLKAYFAHHRADHTSASIEIITASVNLLQPGAQAGLVTAIHDAAQRIGDIALIVVDTLNRTMVGGDENAAADMSRYVANVNAVSESIGAFAMVIHHCGKDASRGARGHSSLRASADLELEVARDANGNGTLRVSKARDGVDGARYGFRLDSVALGVDADGDAVTSCVTVESDVAPARSRSRQLSGVAVAALASLQEAVSAHGKPLPETSTIPRSVRGVDIGRWRSQFAIRYGTEGVDDRRDDATIRKAFARAREALLKDSAIGISDPYVWALR